MVVVEAGVVVVIDGVEPLARVEGVSTNAFNYFMALKEVICRRALRSVGFVGGVVSAMYSAACSLVSLVE